MAWKKGWALLLAALLLFPLTGAAELPADVRVIEEEAFMCNAALKSAALPWGTEEIGDRAFYGCASLSRIAIPSTVDTLGQDCLTGCAGDLLIVTGQGSAAMRWAQENDVDFQAGTRYRALLIAQTYRNYSRYPTLEGPPNDAHAIARCLARLEGTAYETAVETDLSAEGILSAIQRYFADVGEQDVSLFYYSGHGSSSSAAGRRGALLGADGKGAVTAAQLRQALDAVPGRKIVIIDACYSGVFIGEYETRLARSAEETEEGGAEAFLTSFAQAFSRRSRASDYSRYFLLAAAADSEETFEDVVGNKVMGLFTASLAAGLGWNCRLDQPAAVLADTNKNGVVTFREAYEYTWRHLLPEGQHVQAYPESCAWLGLARLTAEGP